MMIIIIVMYLRFSGQHTHTHIIYPVMISHDLCTIFNVNTVFNTKYVYVFGIILSDGDCLKIRPKQCTNALGEEGTCMFVWECIKTEGKHLGTCADGFLFGSCCGHSDSTNLIDAAYTASTTALSVKPTRLPSTTTTTAISFKPTESSTTITYTVKTRPNITSLITYKPLATTTTTQSSTISSTPIYTTSQKPWIIYTGRPATVNSTTKKPAITWPIAIVSDNISDKPLFSNATSGYTTEATTSITNSLNLLTTSSPLPLSSTATSTTASSKQCGITRLRPRTKVVGGKNSAFGAWPWQVSVRRISFFGFSSTHRCGGALLNSRWIATAGHCVDDLLLTQIRIRIGEYDFSSLHEPYPHVERSVKQKIVHPKYNFFTYENDLALLQLDSEIEYHPHIAPICLPPDDFDLMGKNATVTGWGRLSEGGILPTVLQEVRVPIISNDKCKNMFLAAGRHEYIPDIFMCAGFDNGGHDSCQGDSGGPLQVQMDNGQWALAGIISWGIGCGEPSLPGVCTRITKFKQWILSYINQ